MLLGYARVSKTERQGGTAIATQVAALERAGVALERIYQDDGISGAVQMARRPGWAALAAFARPGDCIVTANTSRLSRDLLDGLTAVDGFLNAGIGFQFLSGLDLSDAADPDTRLRFNLELTLAEHQRRSIGVQTKAGHKRARDEGKHIGRPPALDAAAIAQAREWRAAGESVSEIGRRLGCARQVVRNALVEG